MDPLFIILLAFFGALLLLGMTMVIMSQFISWVVSRRHRQEDGRESCQQVALPILQAQLMKPCHSNDISSACIILMPDDKMPKDNYAIGLHKETILA